MIHDKLINLINWQIRKSIQAIHTTTLGKIVNFDPITMRADVELLENVRFEEVYYPSTTIVNALVMYPKVASFYIRVPYKRGDKVVLAFAESDISDMMVSGDKVNQQSTRRHAEDDIIVMGGWSEEKLPTLSGADDDLIIVNSKTNTVIKFTEDNQIIITGLDKLTINCQTATLNANDTTVNSVTTVNGETTINGTTTINGSLKVSEKVESPLMKTATMNATGAMVINGKELKEHTHNYTDDGKQMVTAKPN
ncbi:MAG: Gp138 family membrane-puncturing spike protein [Fusobacteriaceae bacterium]